MQLPRCALTWLFHARCVHVCVHSMTCSTFHFTLCLHILSSRTSSTQPTHSQSYNGGTSPDSHSHTASSIPTRSLLPRQTVASTVAAVIPPVFNAACAIGPPIAATAGAVASAASTTPGMIVVGGMGAKYLYDRNTAPQDSIEG
jgi:Zn-dependent alcohol dehydrogenase